MQQQDSFSDEYSFDDEYSPIIMGDNDMENQAFIGEKDIKKVTQLSPRVLEYFKNYKKLSKNKFMQLFMFKQQVQQHKSVCAKPIQRGSTIAQCYDCATDNSCIQCMDCFKNSNHEGHKVVIKKAYGGCCDCGDLQAWKKQGFCKKHTGQSIDIQIDPKESQNFLTEMKQIFYLLFRQCILENLNFSKDFSNQLLKNLCFMNQKGVYYNKLTCILFGSRISPDLLVSKNVNSRSILANLLSPRVAKHLAIDSWMDLFFSMFQYYPFKKLLLATYMNNFSMIYSEEEGLQRGSSISCQLLTSHQLVKDYTLEVDSIPMGSDIKIEKLGQFDTTFLMLYHDLNYITKLQGDTPLVYFKFHTKSQQGILKMFQYRKIIKNEQDKYQQQPDILQLARFVKYFQLEYKVLDLLTKIAGILQKQKQQLLFIIKTLHDHALKQENQKKMVIFKPLTRALTIFMFAYFDLSLENLNYGKNKQQIDKLVHYIGKNEGSYGNDITKLFKTCVETYLFHAKILAESGLNSTLYGYIYFYKLKTRTVASLDILSVKMLSIMHTWPQVNRQPIISPQDYIWLNSVIKENDTKKQQVQIKIKHLQFILSQLNLVTASQSNELYIAYQINHQCGLYQPYIENILQKLLKQQKGIITLANAKQWAQWFFHPNLDLAQNYMKKFCTYDKVKKAFVYNNNNVQQQEVSQSGNTEFIDYTDFRCNLTNKNNFLSPELTLQLIKQSRSQFINDNLWTIETLKKFIVKAVDYVKLLINAQGMVSQGSQQLPPAIVGKLRPLFDQILKIVYLKKYTMNKSQSQQLQTVIEFINKIQHINQIINPFYQNLLHPEKIQSQKMIHQKGQQSQHMISSPQKDQLKRIKSTEQDRKQKLKEKMQLKKKALKQKYSKQTQKFQQEEKQKLQKQDQQQQVQHKLECIICKNDMQENLVYLVKISYKNHQKLLGLGQGVTCISMSSCYHAVDYDCYRKLESEIGSKRRPMIKCPFCKIQSNTFLPIRASSKIVPDALKKFQGALFMQKNLDQVSILEQIVKSFYHFTLLAYLDPQKTLHRRLRIYKILFEILRENTELYDLQKVYDKFINKKMNLNPKMMEQSYEKKRSQRLLEIGLELQNNSDVHLEDLSQSQVEQLLTMFYGDQQMSDESQSSNSNSGGMGAMFGSALKRLKDKFTSTNKGKQQQQKQKTQKQQNKMSFLFKQTMKRVFQQLDVKQIQEKKQKMQHQHQHEKMEQQQHENSHHHHQQKQEQQQIPDYVELCYKRLFDPKFMYHHNNIYEDLNDNNNLLRLRDLPINFRPLGQLTKCHCCSEISSSMAICLLCDWQGCLRNCLALKRNAQKLQKLQKYQKQNNSSLISKQGGTFNHSKYHGQQSLFMILQSCMVTNITVDGISTSYGCIYKDEWGNDFNRKQPWEKFFLDEGELNRVKMMFLHQQ